MFFPEASNTVIFVIMAIVLLIRPAGLSGRAGDRRHPRNARRICSAARRRQLSVAFAVTVVLLVAAPFVVYPVFLMKALCFALFACAFNLLIGYVGLVSFGHALYFGWASYLAAHAAKVWALPPELAIVVAATAAVLGFLPAASPSAARASISP